MSQNTTDQIDLTPPLTDAAARALAGDDAYMLDRVLACARAGEPFPPYHVFARNRAGIGDSDKAIRAGLKRLAARGVIQLESKPGGYQRRIRLPNGEWTDWSEKTRRNQRQPTRDAFSAAEDRLLIHLKRSNATLYAMGLRLGRGRNSISRRLSELEAAGRLASVAPLCSRRDARPAAPVGTVNTDIITMDADRPAAERDQIAAFLASGKATKLPPAFAAPTESALHACHGIAAESLRTNAARVTARLQTCMNRRRAQSAVMEEIGLDRAAIDALVADGVVNRTQSPRATYLSLPPGCGQ